MCVPFIYKKKKSKMRSLRNNKKMMDVKDHSRNFTLQFYVKDMDCIAAFKSYRLDFGVS